MFITRESGYGRNGEQWARGRFLILMQNDEDLRPCGQKPMRGIVRYVTLRQLGHFMMGKVILAGHVISLSGAYGNDGLVCDVAPEVFALGKDLPTELQEAWNTGGGHNSVGSEAPAMKAWAIENSATQRRRRR